MLADFLIANASEVLTCAGPAPRCGGAQSDAGSLGAGVVAAAGGVILYAGDESGWRARGALSKNATVVDARGGAVVPGFVDAHTHVVFAGDRRDELRRRLGGASYAEVAAAGGGIVSTVRATREAGVEQLAAETRQRLDEMLECGTTSCEAKSGYGLTTESELKQLRVMHDLDRSHPIEISRTFMGAHEIPVEFRAKRREYIDLLIADMLPAVAAAGAAEWCDVFCERDVFSPDESREILGAARKAGLKLRIHADELASSGGSDVAAELAVRSADHLIHATEAAARRFAAAGVVATLLPIASLYLKLGRFAPARMFIDHGVPVALGTDINPGAGFSPSMPFAMTLACFGMGLTFEEALIAATLNSAYSLERHPTVGSLEAGKQMDAVVVAGPAIDLIRVGAETVRFVIKKGRVVAHAD